MTYYFALALSIALGGVGQILLKYSTTYKAIYSVGMVNEVFAVAAIIYGLSLLLYTYSLREIPLTIAYPAVSISYILVALLSWVIFDTHVGLKDLFGFLLIASGVLMIASSQS